MIILNSKIEEVKGFTINCRVRLMTPVLIYYINTGFLIGYINIHQNLYLLLSEGYLGAYTTFSTFMYEGFNLFRNNEKINAIIYILGTLFLGLIGFIIGANINKLLI